MNRWNVAMGAVLAAASAVMVAPGKAHAVQEYWPPTNNSHFITIGTLTQANRPYFTIEMKDLVTGACSINSVSSPGLSDYTYIHGSGGNDIMVVATAGYRTPCGYTFSAPNLNGYGFLLLGESGNDSIYGGSIVIRNTDVRGGRGNDTVVAGPGGTGHGGDGSGNDSDGTNFIYGQDNSGDTLFGARGSDHLCEHSNVTVDQLAGFGGADTRCGRSRNTAVPASVASIERVDCPICGSGY
jgi:hypothetical protein